MLLWWREGLTLTESEVPHFFSNWSSLRLCNTPRSQRRPTVCPGLCWRPQAHGSNRRHSWTWQAHIPETLQLKIVWIFEFSCTNNTHRKEMDGQVVVLIDLPVKYFIAPRLGALFSFVTSCNFFVSHVHGRLFFSKKKLARCVYFSLQ